MKAHVIENGIITNTIVVHALDDMPNLVDAAIGGYIGWSWNNGNPTPPEEVVVVPTEVTMAQAQQELLANGLLDAVENYIATSSRADQIDWQHRQTVRRDWPLVSAVAGELELTSAQLDALFIGASRR
jgi:hypothetical protein